MRIPEQIRARLMSAGEGGTKLGVKISMEFLKEAKSFVAGVYMMPPFKKYHIIDELLSVI
jgi:hypothetical protein